MASKIARISPLKHHACRAYSVRVAPKASVAHFEALPKQDVEMTTLPSGLVVTSLENYSPVTRLAIIVKGGARYEDGSNLGITHTLRNAAGLATKNCSKFAITKNIEYLGANLTATTTREHLIYTLECNRNEVGTAFKFATEVALCPAFKHWEVDDAAPTMKLDLAIYRQNQEAVLMEALHAAAFRGGLGNSLFIEDFMVGKHTPRALAEFTKNHVTGPRVVLAAVGAEGDRLVHALKHLELRSDPGAEFLPSKFAGSEVRREFGSSHTAAAVVVEGASAKNAKECLALGVLQHILGTGPRVPYSASAATKLGDAAAKVAEHPFAVSALNISYSDTGLFGVTVAGHPNEMDKLTKAVMTQVRTTAQKISDKDVQDGKTRLKAALLFKREDQSNVALEMGLQTSLLGQAWDPSEVERSIDAITTQDVASVAARVSKAKPAMAAVGRLHKTPHVDELV
ncbi:cytochrome b-c1 complex subunit 2, mitochondrial [Ixodes scapularis]